MKTTKTINGRTTIYAHVATKHQISAVPIITVDEADADRAMLALRGLPCVARKCDGGATRQTRITARRLVVAAGINL